MIMKALMIHDYEIMMIMILYMIGCDDDDNIPIESICQNYRHVNP